jgi:hypothetical protein
VILRKDYIFESTPTPYDSGICIGKREDFDWIVCIFEEKILGLIAKHFINLDLGKICKPGLLNACV